jgi:hypothetical protein
MRLRLPNQHLLPIIGLHSLVDQLLSVEELRPTLLLWPVVFPPNRLVESNTGHPMSHQGGWDSQQVLAGI